MAESLALAGTNRRNGSSSVVKLVESAILWREVRQPAQERGSLAEPTASVDQGCCLNLANQLSGQASPRWNGIVLPRRSDRALLCAQRLEHLPQRSERGGWQ